MHLYPFHTNHVHSHGMEGKRYILLLNDSLKRDFLSLPEKEKKRLMEKIEFLENGIWDTGVRVKKLKGVSGKVIFEARLSRGDRIIFTLGRSGPRTVVYIWGVIHHDDISRTARKIIPENAPFLDFEPLTDENYPDLLFDDLPEKFFTQESIEEKSSEDYGPQKWLFLDDNEWKRLLLKTNPDNFEIFLFLTQQQMEVLERKPPLLLSGTAGSGKTTISVYYLLRNEFKDRKRLFLTCSSYLKQFSENIYRGLVVNSQFEDSRGDTDFYIFRDLLKEINDASGIFFDPKKEVGLKEFTAIFEKHALSKKYDAELVWEEIRSIIKGANPPISLKKYKELVIGYLKNRISRSQLQDLKDSLLELKNFEFITKIERIATRKTNYSDYESFIQDLRPIEEITETAIPHILQEILRILEKRSNRFDSALLTLNEYLNLGRKRAPNFLYNREEIYTIAEYYQEKLEEEKRYDEIDLCKHAICHLDQSGNSFSWDLVVCDEAQDFSDIQISLIFRLTRSFNNIVFAGDPKQIINPSGFRWEEVKNRFYERGVPVPNVFHLNLNFRCVGSIVKLSNALLDLKQQIIGISGYEQKEDWKFNGRPPFLIHGINEGKVLESVRLTGAGRIILVRSEGEKRKLKKALGTELIFTINEAKGLEFDTVFLWKFSSDRKSSDLWRRILGGHYLEPAHHPHIRHEINLLYVAVTRARNTLIIYDGNHPSDVWKIDLLQRFIFSTEGRQVLSEIWKRVSSPGEWESQGHYFFNREHYRAAVECFKNAGNDKMSELSRAHILVSEKRYLEAAELFYLYNQKKKAAENFELGEAFDKALSIWKELKEGKRKFLCEIHLLENNGAYGQAAERWLKLMNYKNAIRAWERAGENRKIGDYYYSRKDYKPAAENFEKAKAYKSAALCFKKLKEYRKAADMYFKGTDYGEAAPLYKKLKDDDRLLTCYRKLKDYSNTALFYEKRKDYDSAIEEFRKFISVSEENRNNLLDAADAFQTPHSQIKAAVRYSALSLHEKSAPIFLKKGHFELAYESYSSTGNYLKAGECKYKLGEYYEAVEELEKSESEECLKMADAALEAYIYPGGMYDRKRAEKLFGEAESQFRKKSFNKALIRYTAINHPEGVFKTYLKIDRDEEALRYLMRNEEYDYAGKFVNEKQNLNISVRFLTEISENRDGRSIWDLDENSEEEVVITLFHHLLKKGKNNEMIKLIHKYLSTFYSFYFIKDLPDKLIDLVLETKHYNTIIKMVTTESYSIDNDMERFNSFLNRLTSEAEMENDNALKACSCFLTDRERYENIVAGIEINMSNYKLFAVCNKYYLKAVDLLIKENDRTEAAMICRMMKNFKRSAEIEEESGDIKGAAQIYRDHKYYEDALRCYESINDEAGKARVYERMKDYDRALEIWNKLGKTREVNRLLKKKEKQAAKKAQLNLF